MARPWSSLHQWSICAESMLKRNSMLRLGGTGMNGLALPRPAAAAGR
jgi:hypothetical protein